MNYKSVETIIPDYMQWMAVDPNGEIWVFENKPKFGGLTFWYDFSGARSIACGRGPAPKDASQELYRLEFAK